MTDNIRDRVIDVLRLLDGEAGGDVVESVRGDYSGRGMYGRQCLGVVVPNISALFTLGQMLAEHDWMGEPDTDSMGRSFIAYWPSVQVSREEQPEGDEPEVETAP